MSNYPFTQPLRGIIPPIATPLRDRDSLDEAGLERLVEHLLNGGVSGLFVLGTMGEGPSLSYRLRREVIDRICQQVRGRVPVLVGITDPAFVESVNVARHAADAGADAVVLAPPFYMQADQADLTAYVGDLLPELPLPLLLYNMPGLTKVAFEVPTVRRLMEHPKIVGLKDSSANMIYFHQLAGLLPQRPDWTLLMGPEQLLVDTRLAGGHGGITAGANLFPALYGELWRAAEADEWERARILHAQVMRVAESVYQIGGYPAGIVKGVKCALSCLGICSDVMAEPFRAFGNPEREMIAAAVARLGEEIGKVLAPAPGGRAVTP